MAAVPQLPLRHDSVQLGVFDLQLSQDSHAAHHGGPALATCAGLATPPRPLAADFLGRALLRAGSSADLRLRVQAQVVPARWGLSYWGRPNAFVDLRGPIGAPCRPAPALAGAGGGRRLGTRYARHDGDRAG